MEKPMMRARIRSSKRTWSREPNRIWGKSQSSNRDKNSPQGKKKLVLFLKVDKLGHVIFKSSLLIHLNSRMLENSHTYIIIGFSKKLMRGQRVNTRSPVSGWWIMVSWWFWMLTGLGLLCMSLSSDWLNLLLLWQQTEPLFCCLLRYS